MWAKSYLGAIGRNFVWVAAALAPWLPHPWSWSVDAEPGPEQVIQCCTSLIIYLNRWSQHRMQSADYTYMLTCLKSHLVHKSFLHSLPALSQLPSMEMDSRQTLFSVALVVAVYCYFPVTCQRLNILSAVLHKLNYLISCSTLKIMLQDLYWQSNTHKQSLFQFWSSTANLQRTQWNYQQQ